LPSVAELGTNEVRRVASVSSGSAVVELEKLRNCCPRNLSLFGVDVSTSVDSVEIIPAEGASVVVISVEFAKVVAVSISEAGELDVSTEVAAVVVVSTEDVDVVSAIRTVDGKSG
jgi:hypothetical protein